MKKISATMENRLLRALEATADHVASGLSPTDAVVKAAIAAELPRGGVEKLAHAYNTARTTRQREDNNSIFDKAADFSLADADKAIAAIFPATMKTAAERVTETAVSEDYAVSPRSFLQERERVKTAATLSAPRMLPEGKAPKPYRPEPTYGIRKAYGTAEQAKKDSEESRRKVSAAFDKMSSAFCRLTNLCMRPSSHPLDIIRRNIEVQHGKVAGVIVDKLIEVTPQLPKMAQHQVGTAAWHRCDNEPAVGPIYDTVADLLSTTQAYNAAVASHEEIKKACEARAEVALAPFAKAAGDQSIVDPASPTLAQLRSSRKSTPVPADPMPPKTKTTEQCKQAMPSVWQTLGSLALAKGMFDSVARDLHPPSSDEMVQKTLDKLTDPEHESRLRAINTQATLHDFMLNDPVISRHDPQTVMDAFNSVTQLAPSIADQRLPLQTLLRKQLEQGALDTFDLDQTLKLEHGLRQRNLIPKPTGLLSR
jgi:hypothetical protein